MSSHCPICGLKLKKYKNRPYGQDADLFSCPLCGDFLLSRSLIPGLPELLKSDKDSIAKISHSLRQMHEFGKASFLYTSTVKKILKRQLPTPKEQADLLIRWLGKKLDSPGELIKVESTTYKSIIGAKSDDNFAFIIKSLFDTDLLMGNIFETMGAPFGANITLTFDGWNYYENLKSGFSKYRKAFIAMKFGDPSLDEIIDNTFKPFVKQAGFDLIRIDDEPKAGLIDDRLRVEIQSSQFLIADLTHDNPGAYWEAGYAEGLGKPVIYTCEKTKFENEKTHFDTNHHLTVIWDIGDPHKAGESLKATIRATFPNMANMED
jgi:hypothetical protein